MDAKTPLNPILIVDDEPNLLRSFTVALRTNGIDNVITCADSREVEAIMSRQPVELVLLDLLMPHVSGEELLPRLINASPATPILIITAVNQVDHVVRCIQMGAFDYLVKPVDETRLLTSIRRAREYRDLQRTNASLQQSFLTDTLKHPDLFVSIVTRNAHMLRLLSYTEAVASSPQPVLITGETGTGKELIARAIHAVSKRNGPFVAVNLSGLDDTTFTDTMFGHRKGAFAGAVNERPGIVEEAANGTLFLDEIGDLNGASQIRLLRFLQEQEYFALGSDTPRRGNVRIIAATNRDHAILRTGGSFRTDLYYRLMCHHIHLPPLRERREDVPLLTGHFLREAAGQLGKTIPTPPRELFNLLDTYTFPGNVRELRAMVLDAVSCHTGGVLSADIFKAHIQRARAETIDTSVSIATPDQRILFPTDLPTAADCRRQLINEALRRAGNNQSIAANLLGVSRQTLNRFLQSKRNTLS